MVRVHLDLFMNVRTTGKDGTVELLHLGSRSRMIATDALRKIRARRIRGAWCGE